MVTCSYSEIVGGTCVTCGPRVSNPAPVRFVKKLDNAADILEVIFARSPLPRSCLHAARNPLVFFRNVNISCESKPKQRNRKKIGIFSRRASKLRHSHSDDPESEQEELKRNSSTKMCSRWS